MQLIRSKWWKFQPRASLVICSAVYVLSVAWSHSKYAATSLQRDYSPGSIRTFERDSDAVMKNNSGTFVIQVRGEMGNHLQKIAHGYGLQWLAQDYFQFSPRLVVKHLKKPKWKTARNDIIQCFPKLRHLDYEGAHHAEFQRLLKTHASWITQQNSSIVENAKFVREETFANISIGLDAMKQLIDSSSTKVENRPSHSNDFPIVVLGGPMRNILVDFYYHHYRTLFEFDNSACCVQIPEPDEVVFHFRHFAKELSLEEQRSRGFEELEPDRVVPLLMGHLQPGQKVAMTTRFANEPVVEEYVQAMRQHQLQVRVVTNQTGVQDFCFLLRAQQELLGVAKSTYARWAAYLGDAKRVQLYALNNPGSQEFIEQTMRYPWKNSELRQRIHYPVFPSKNNILTT